jgi:hypothetical protein
VAVLSGLPSPLLLLQFVLKDVAVHLALLYDQKLPKASSVSLDRLFMYLVAYRRCVGSSSLLRHGFPGGALKVAPTTSGWSLSSFASLLATLFCRVFSGPVFPFFQCQALERWLELLPSRGCVAHSAVKRMFAFCAKGYLLQLDAPLLLLDAEAFNRCILRCLLSWHPGDFRFHRFGRRFRRSDPWHTFFAAFPQMDERLSW